ncbi:uncharacterized protein C7orf57 homolog [Haliotis cracherodii]|uniref:uncharacterized protein C7orf57 homolog n=1 Tax=Haliotis cracherodii TaxID=6455 RepID=UPI0039EC3C64
MTMNQKINECGWFYHAPERRKVNAEPVEVPLTSQIPGLSDLPPEFDDKPREMYFKDTDTKYIRLAKQGGRKDLLEINSCAPKSSKPRGYPRVDWFYLEDNAVEDAAKKEETNWEFLLPEYMVHDSQKAAGVDFEPESISSLKERRAPYAFDLATAYQREGQALKDKTVKLPEEIPAGYGIRNSKPPHAKKQAAQGRRAVGNAQGDKPKPKSAQSSEAKVERPAMDKLLSYAYDKEWHGKMKDLHEKQDKHKVADGSLKSEYRDTFHKSAGRTRTRRDRTVDILTDKITDRTAHRRNSAEEKEPFKLTKFKNVPARIDTHQKPDTQRSLAASEQK